MYPQSSGSAEHMVQTVENILKKSDEKVEDPYLGLLSYHMTPASSNLKSPAEQLLLNIHKFRTTLPMSKPVSVSDTTSKTKEELIPATKPTSILYITTTRLLSRHYNHFNQVSQSTFMTTTLRDGNHKFRTTLPMSKPASVSNTTSKTKEELYQRQKLQAFYYNKTAKLKLQPFQPGQPINIYDHHTQTWEQGTVIRPAKEPRSFIIKNDQAEGVCCRTQSQLKPRPKVRDDSIKDPPPTTHETAALQDSSATLRQDDQAYTTRSGHTSKPPSRLDV